MIGAVPMTMAATGPTITDRRLCRTARITARATVKLNFTVFLTQQIDFAR
jgi:hypothetical protein